VRHRGGDGGKDDTISGATVSAFGVAGAVVGVEATGQLPFTGLVLGLFLLVGLALVLSGLLVRFLGARKS
jgi:hypothetical protein